MSHQTTAPPEPLLGLDPTAPLIRPLPFPIEHGRVWTAGLDENGRPIGDELLMVTLRTTPRGHWYLSTDWFDDEDHGSFVQCRGCGRLCEDPYFSLDDRPCGHPATAQDVASALLASVPRPAPARPAVSFERELYRRLRRVELEAAL